MAHQCYEFGMFTLDLAGRELRRKGVPIPIRTKVFDLLAFLIRHRERVVLRAEVMEYVWQSVEVSDATLDSTVRSVRHAIEDDARSQRLVKTIRGKGLRFVGDVQVTETLNTDPPSPPDGPSIALLPFANIGGEIALEHLADGLVEDLTTELSRYKQFTVIARNSSFQYRGLANDLREIGRSLGAQYILEGSVRRNGEALRVTGQLTHADTQRHVWADNFECPFDNPSSLQARFLRQMIQAIGAELTFDTVREAADKRDSEDRPIAMAWRARALLNRSRATSDPTFAREGMALAEKAAATDPNCRQAWWTISFANYMVAFARGGQDAAPFLKRAREAAETLLSLDRTDFRAHESLGWVSYLERDLRGAHLQLQHAHRLNPNSAMTLTLLGVVETSLGDAERGFDRISQAIVVSPRDMWLGFMLASLALACFALGRYADGAKHAQEAVHHDPRSQAGNLIFAACAYEAHDLPAARAAIARQVTTNAQLLTQYADGERSPYQQTDVATRFRAALQASIAKA